MSGITHKWDGTILTITSDSGTSSCDLKGAAGETGPRGPRGEAGETVSVNGKMGIVTLTAADVEAISQYEFTTAITEVNAAIGEMQQDQEAAAKETIKRDRVYNLLDNSYFKMAVNQRGFTSKETDASGTTYIADRWLWWNLATANYSISISNNGFTVTTKSGTTRLLQRIEPNKVDATKTYTAYCMCTDGTMILGSVNNTTFGWGDGGYSCLFDIPAGKTVIWAAAYEGAYTAETFPAYVPKGYAAELMECMRYYYQIDSSVTMADVGDAYGQSKWELVLPVKMRIAPTVTYTLDSLLVDNTNMSYNRIDAYHTTERLKFNPVTLNANLKNKVMVTTLSNIKASADL